MSTSRVFCGGAAWLVSLLVMNAGVSGANRSWDGLTDTMWSEASNWTPDGVPLSSEDVFIGNLFGIPQQFVDLDINDSVGSLTINNGHALDLEGNRLFVSGATLVSGEREAFENIFWTSRIIVRPAGLLPALDTDELIISDQASVSLGDPGGSGLGLLEVDVLLDIEETGSIGGKGVIRLNGDGNVSLVNDGVIAVGAEGMTINQNGSGLLDLDGSGGDGSVQVSSFTVNGLVSSLTLNGDGLSDIFNGAVELARGAMLAMNLAEGWETGSGSLVRVSNDGGQFQNDPTVISGGSWRHGAGTFELTAGGAAADVTADVTIESAANVIVSQDASLDYDGLTVVNGGMFAVSKGGRIDFDNTTELAGGTFNMETVDDDNGLVVLSGVTTWSGDVTFNGGMVIQLANAVVASPTTIDATIINMDGSGLTEWTIQSSLVVNAADIDGASGNVFNGRIEVGAGEATRLTINLTDAGDDWTAAGELAMTGGVLEYQTKLAGSVVRLSGDLFVSRLSEVPADIDFQSTSRTSWRDADTRLRVQGETTIESGATFIDPGVLVNGESGEMVIEPGVGFDATRLENEGVMRIGAGVGEVTTAGFEQFEGALLKMQVFGGGQDAFDRLLVGGPLVLDGLLELQVPGADFLPYGTVIPLMDGVSRVGMFEGVIGQVVTGTWALAVVYPAAGVQAMVALPGDANLDGVVDLIDLSILASGFEGTGTWVDGNFNGDGAIDLIDLSLLATNFGEDVNGLPEPGAMMLLGLGALGLRRR
ncbi:MAG: hypothetical protein RLN76_03825 [Phycisphaeraceae bacterium]